MWYKVVLYAMASVLEALEESEEDGAGSTWEVGASESRVIEALTPC